MFLHADRTYVFEIHGDKLYNTYEWCAEHVTPEIDKLQGIDLSLIDRWREKFDQCECVVVEDVEQIKDSSLSLIHI